MHVFSSPLRLLLFTLTVLRVPLPVWIGVVMKIKGTFLKGRAGGGAQEFKAKKLALYVELGTVGLEPTPAYQPALTLDTVSVCVHKVTSVLF